jgi:hypothetical protein
MKIHYLSLALLFSSSIWGSFSEEPRLQYFTGYRNDQLHWHLQDPGDEGQLLYSEAYKNLQFWENALSLTVYHRDIYVFLSGSYAAFGQGGILRERYAHLPYAANQPRFMFTPQGWASDGSGHFGYCINLTEGRLYKVLLVPFLGGSMHYESLERNDPKPSLEESSQAIGASSYTMSSQLPGRLNLTWYGFLVGGFFHIDPGSRLLFDVGYYYSWLHLHFHTHYANEVSMGAPLFTNQTAHSSIKAKTAGNLGHTGWIKGSYRLNAAWQAGLAAQINYFVSRDLDAKNKQSLSNQPTIKTSEKLKIRWTAVSGWATLSRSF